jgi:hypothetical protein
MEGFKLEDLKVSDLIICFKNKTRIITELFEEASKLSELLIIEKADESLSEIKRLGEQARYEIQNVPGAERAYDFALRNLEQGKVRNAVYGYLGALEGNAEVFHINRVMAELLMVHSAENIFDEEDPKTELAFYLDSIENVFTREDMRNSIDGIIIRKLQEKATEGISTFGEYEEKIRDCISVQGKANYEFVVGNIILKQSILLAETDFNTAFSFAESFDAEHYPLIEEALDQKTFELARTKLPGEASKIVEAFGSLRNYKLMKAALVL